MKFASLVFLLVPFAVNAADLCVEDNILKCKELGYTESSCPYGGVACQYDTSLWYCAKWTCEDGRLYSEKNKPTNAECVETAYKDMTCYDCTEGQPLKGCAIGDVFYADGSCSSVNNFDENKIPVGVVYALSATKGGVPYTTAKAETEGFRAEHGRVINLKNLHAMRSTNNFKPDDPYLIKVSVSSESQDSFHAGQNSCVTGLTKYSNSSMITAFQNNVEELYSGNKNTDKFISTVSYYFNHCPNGDYKEGTKNYNQNCHAHTAKAARAFYPPNTNKNDPIVGAGNWYQPAIGELALLYGLDVNAMTQYHGNTGATGTTVKKINTTLAIIEQHLPEYASQIGDSFWSTNERVCGEFWIIDTSDGSRVSTSNDNWGKLRVSLEF